MQAAWLGKVPQRKRPVFYEYGRDEGYVKPGWESDQSPTLMMRDANWKFLCNADGSKAELYDRSRDPKESHNLIGAQAKRAETMQKKLLAWHKTLPDVQAK
jgi:uncharacterized sulfatase